MDTVINIPDAQPTETVEIATSPSVVTVNVTEQNLIQTEGVSTVEVPTEQPAEVVSPDVIVTDNGVIDDASIDEIESEEKSDAITFGEYDTTIEDEDTNIEFKPIIFKPYVVIDDFEMDENLKKIFFDSFELGVGESKEEKELPQSPLDVLDDFKRMGEHINVYLPMSNVAVRIYEFDNDVFLPTIYPGILDDFRLENGTAAFVNPLEITHDKLFINKILENSEIISKDGKTLGATYAIDKLSNADMNILMLGAIILLLKTDKDIPDDKKDVVSIDVRCGECEADLKLQVSLNALLKSQYETKHLELARKSFSMEDTFSENFARSLHVTTKKTGKRYTKNGSEFEMVVVNRDPKYSEATKVESRAILHILDTYEYLLPEDWKEQEQYDIKSMKYKLYSLLEYLENAPEMEVYQAQIARDIENVNMILYTHSILTRTVADSKVITKTLVNETPMSSLFILFNRFDKTFREAILARVAELHKYTTGSRIMHDFTCSNPACGHKNSAELSSRALVFFILQTRNALKMLEESQI